MDLWVPLKHPWLLGTWLPHWRTNVLVYLQTIYWEFQDVMEHLLQPNLLWGHSAWAGMLQAQPSWRGPRVQKAGRGHSNQISSQQNGKFHKVGKPQMSILKSASAFPSLSPSCSLVHSRGNQKTQNTRSQMEQQFKRRRVNTRQDCKHIKILATQTAVSSGQPKKHKVVPEGK